MNYLLRISRVLFVCLALYSASSPLTWAGPGHDEDEKELFLVAQKAFEDGFYDVAIRYIDQFLRKYSETEKRVQARLLLGQCYFFKSQYLKAYDIFQDLLPFSEFKDATLFWLGETYFKGSDYKQAEKYYRQLIEVYPASVYVPQAYYSLAWTRFEQDDYTRAKDLFLKLIKKFPTHSLSEDAVFKLGECEYNTSAYTVASQYFKNYILAYPQSTRRAEAYFYIAESYYSLEDFLTAVTYYAKAADIAYDKKLTFMAKVSMGWSYLKLDKYELSQKCFDEARELSRDEDILSDDIYLGQASLYSKMGEKKKAAETYRELIERFPNSPRIAEAHLGKANVDYTRKDYAEAIKEYQWIIDQYSGEPGRQMILEKATYGLAWTYLKTGNIDLAIKNFEKIMHRTQSKIVKVSALTQIGDAYQDNNALEKAIAVYDRILKDYPDSIYTDYVQFRQGIALLKSNKIEAATLSFQSLQANFPQSKYLNDVKYYLGVAYFTKEDWRQAINYAKDYLKELPASSTFASEAHYICALSDFNLENYAGAIPVFQKIIKNYPAQKPMVWISELSIAKCFYHLGREKEAIKAFKTILAKYPETEATQTSLLWLGDHYFEKAEMDQAVFYYKQLLKDFPGSDKVNVVRYELGQAYQFQGKLDTALNYYKLIDNSVGEAIYAKAKLAIADLFSKDLSPETAIETYLNIALSAPDFKRNAYVKIAGVHEKNKEYKQALAAYEEALNAEEALSELSSAEIQFYIADTHEVLNETETAVEAYLKIPYLYTREKAWIIKAYLRTARIFEDNEKWQQAKITYGKIIDYQMEESKYAEERLDWIKENAGETTY